MKGHTRATLPAVVGQERDPGRTHSWWIKPWGWQCHCCSFVPWKYIKSTFYATGHGAHTSGLRGDQGLCDDLISFSKLCTTLRMNLSSLNRVSLWTVVVTDWKENITLPFGTLAIAGGCAEAFPVVVSENRWGSPPPPAHQVPASPAGAVLGHQGLRVQ